MTGYGKRSRLLHERRYGKWAGNPEGYPYCSDRCAQEIYGAVASSQCSRPRGHGPDGLYCKQHADIVSERKSGKGDQTPAT